MASKRVRIGGLGDCTRLSVKEEFMGHSISCEMLQNPSALNWEPRILRFARKSSSQEVWRGKGRRGGHASARVRNDWRHEGP